MMKRCPYSVLLLDHRWAETKQHYPQCERRSVLGSSGWHLHRARVPKELAHSNDNLRLCWRSTNTPDYVVDHVRDRR